MPCIIITYYVMFHLCIRRKRHYIVTTFKFIKCMSYGNIICIDL
jgi:hypothetical protein